MKGIFTQGICVLLDAACTLDEVEALLRPLQPGRRSRSGGRWAFESGALAVGLPGGSGALLVDVVPRPYPDALGGEEDPELFAAWSLGYFGPLAWPGALARALPSVAPSLRARAARHGAWVRVLTTYSTGRGEDVLLPPGYDALRECMAVTEVALALLHLPGAIAWWDPAGETLLTHAQVHAELEAFRQGGPPPVRAWTRGRAAELVPVPGWTLCERVGLQQFDLPDLEACFPSGSEQPQAVEGALLDVACYLVEARQQLASGDHLDFESGGRWRTLALGHGLRAPPRPVLRLFPASARVPPALEQDAPEPSPGEALEPHYQLWLERRRLTRSGP